MGDLILLVLLIILICVICCCISSSHISELLVIGGAGLFETDNRNKQIMELRSKYSINDILNLIKSNTKSEQYGSVNQYNILDNKVVFATEESSPPYAGLILILNVKKVTSQLLVDIMTSISLREFAYIVLIDVTKEVIVLGTSKQLEDFVIGKPKEFLTKYLDGLTDITITGLQITNPALLQQLWNLNKKSDVSHKDLEWDMLSNLTERDIQNLDWSELLAKIPEWCENRKYEVGGNAVIKNGKVTVSNINEGNIGQVNVKHVDLIVFHSHPKSGIFAEPPSVTDLNSALHGFKHKESVLDVVIACEGLYVYRPSQFILAHDNEIRDKLDNLSIGCYRMNPSLCVPIVLNRIRDTGFIIYFIPNPPYWKAIENNSMEYDYAFNYWNTIDNVKFLKTIEELKKYKTQDFEKLDWSEIQNVKKLSHGDSLIVADIVDGKVLVAGGAGARQVLLTEPLQQPPGRFPATLDIIVQSSEEFTGYELKHIIESSNFVAWCIAITPTRSYAIRVDKKIKIDDSVMYSLAKIGELGFIAIQFKKI